MFRDSIFIDFGTFLYTIQYVKYVSALQGVYINACN